MQEQEKHTLRKVIIIIFIVFLLFGLWARYINTKGLNIKEFGITNKELPTSFHGLKIIHFSDILYGNTTNIDDIKNIVKNINNQKPDIVFFTGDLLDKDLKISAKEKKQIIRELKKIDVKLYKYAICGDNDLKKYNTYKDIIETSEFVLLNNSNELLYYEGQTPIKIVGLSDTKDLESAFKEDSAKQSFTIVLTHKPNTIDKLSKYEPNLVFAGHNLGGQIKIPFLGGIINKDSGKNYSEDYYKENNTSMYVSSGIGTDNIKIRTFNKPSINLYRIYSQ